MSTTSSSSGLSHEIVSNLSKSRRPLLLAVPTSQYAKCHYNLWGLMFILIIPANSKRCVFVWGWCFCNYNMQEICSWSTTFWFCTFWSLAWHIINQQSPNKSCSWLIVMNPESSSPCPTCNPESNSFSCFPCTKTVRSIFNRTTPNPCLQHLSNPERKRDQSTWERASHVLM